MPSKPIKIPNSRQQYAVWSDIERESISGFSDDSFGSIFDLKCSLQEFNDSVIKTNSHPECCQELDYSSSPISMQRENSPISSYKSSWEVNVLPIKARQVKRNYDGLILESSYDPNHVLSE